MKRYINFQSEMFSFLITIMICVTILAVEGLHLAGPDGYQCGVEASPSLIHRNPWLVLLEYYRRGGQTEHRCGGTLVSSRHVVTAAHCVMIKADMYKVRVGEYDLRTKEDCVEGVCSKDVKSIGVAKVTVHPAYDGASHDIAVLTLESDVPYTNFIRPICLPTANPVNTTFTTAGWGEIPKTVEFSDIKKDIPLPLWDDAKCRAAYTHTELSHDIICAGGEDGLDSCRGDSGGPLVESKESTNTKELAGVTSKGFVVCGTEGKPGIYTSVYTYLDWIQEVMDKV